jgi:dCMP deaminase
MDIALVVAQRSHDAETKVGAVLVNDKSGSVIANSFNGYVRGTRDSELPNTRPLKYEFIIHAEQNLIVNCARLGIPIEGCSVVCTHSPCKLCMRLLVNGGITKVIARELYKDFQDILNMPDVKTSMTMREDGFYEITYQVDQAS